MLAVKTCILLGRMRFAKLLIACFGTLQAAEYRAGVARLDITPQEPGRLAGYAARTKLSESVAMRLYAKALAIDDRKGNRFVLVTTDLIGLTRSVGCCGG